MIIENNPKRLAIYFFFDKNGVVDKFVPLFLEDLKKNVTDLLIVSNGAPTEEGTKILESYGELFVRENVGFDVWAYKESLEHCGWEVLEQYDEVLLLNSTIMGPVFPLKETFDKMDAKDLDFWGMTMYFEQNCDPSGCCRYGYIPDHIQSHFIACRKTLVKSREFQEYWETMPMIHTYWEAVGKHEMIFTKHFNDLGFKSALSVDMEDLRSYSGYPLMMCPAKLIKERRCPIFKRRMFFHDAKDFLSQTGGEQAEVLYHFLQSETDYDTDLIWDAIIKGYHHADIVKNLNLYYILSEKLSDREQSEAFLKEQKVALMLYYTQEYFVEEAPSWMFTMPEGADVYLIVDSQELKKKTEEKFAGSGYEHLEVRIQEQGGDVGALLVGMKDVIEKYDLVCFAQDAEGQGNAERYSCGHKCMGSLLASKAFVENVIAAFAQDPRLGFLAPPPANHASYFTNIGREWRSYYEDTAAWMKKLGIQVPVSADKPPVAPLETVGWFRPEALKPLYEIAWDCEELQKENEQGDKPLARVIERLYPYAVQQMGFYPGVLLSDRTAKAEYGNLNYYVREYNTILMNHGIESYHQYMSAHLEWVMSIKQEREVMERMSLPGLLKFIVRFWYRSKKNRK